jgi:hypothetical protein
MKKNILFSAVLLFFLIEQAWAQPTGYDNPLLAENIPQFIWQMIILLFTASLYLAPLMILIGAYIIATSGGIPSKVDRGKKIIIWTLIALAIILISRGIIHLVLFFLGG